MNPAIFSYGNFSLNWYPVLLSVAALAGFSLVQTESERFNIDKEFVFNMLFWVIIFGFLGARLYYVIFNWDYYSQNFSEILKVWKGGLAIHGGIIVGLFTVFLYTKKYKVRFVRYLDFLAVPLLLSQAIGRWGNFFNSEAYGLATTANHLKKIFIPDFVINGMKIDGTYYLPMFYFESVSCFLFFVLLMFIRRGKYLKVGSLTGMYLIGYGIIRFFIEMSRTDALMLGGFKVAQIMSFIMLIIGVIMLMINYRKSKFEDLYNDKNNIEEIIF